MIMRKTADKKGKVIAEIPNGTCILVSSEDGEWCEVSWNNKTGYCMTEFLVMFREADLSLLDYRVLQKGDKGDDVLALKKRLKELGYIRGSATLTNRYTKETAQRVHPLPAAGRHDGRRHRLAGTAGISLFRQSPCLYPDPAPGEDKGGR